MNCIYCTNEASNNCKRCLAPYCSRECQVSDWAVHKATCVPIDIAVNNMLNKILGNVIIFQTYHHATNVEISVDDYIYILNMCSKPCKVTLSYNNTISDASSDEFTIFLKYKDYKTSIKYPISNMKFKKNYVPAGNKWTILIQS